MQKNSDPQLLREYVEHGTEAAFGEIVARHADLVYSAALRQVGSPDLASDIAQSVFTDLARKAPSLACKLGDGEALVGWLYRGTRYAALTFLRDERRRLTRERQVMELLDPASAPPADWDRIRPVLDEAMASLSGQDRDALLLRFFRNQDFRAVGSTLGVSDDAAQKRVARALEKLRAYLTRRGVTTTVAALATGLSANAVQIAPAGLAATLTSASLAGTAGRSGTTVTLFKIMTMTKVKVGIIGAIAVACLGTPLVIEHQNEIHLWWHHHGLWHHGNDEAGLAAPQNQTPQSPAKTEGEACRNNLRQINGAIEQFALENRRKTGDTAPAEQIALYLKENEIPQCPSGGIYTIPRVGDLPTCSIQGHSH